MRYFSLIFIFLIACSSGGNGLAPEIDPIDELPKVITPEENPIPTGAASYRGPAQLSFSPRTSGALTLDGTLGLDVNFGPAAQSVGGSIGGFQTASGGAVVGTLFLSGGELDKLATTPIFIAQFSGSLKTGDENYTAFGTMNGEFLEKNQSAVTGRIAGTVRQAGGDVTLTGTFNGGRLP